MVYGAISVAVALGALTLSQYTYLQSRDGLVESNARVQLLLAAHER